jgi:hypothetical protein
MMQAAIYTVISVAVVIVAIYASDYYYEHKGR